MKTETVCSRRDFVRFGAATGGILLSGGLPAPAAAAQKDTDPEGFVGAVEDLMREHGVLRRALIVYSETAARLRNETGKINAGALAGAAKLFRAFGEHYHERMLEEQFIFPAVRKSGGDAARLVDVLIAQHDRGREITGYILSVSGGGKIGVGQALPLARALESMVRMYRAHAAREDTVVFPAWKKTMDPEHLGEMAERFEDIEHRQFGADGFEDAVQRIGRVERALGITGLSSFTAPPPPAEE